MASLFDENEYPALSKLMSQPVAAPPPEQPRSNWAVSGLSAGIDQFQGLGGAALGALGQITNVDSLRDYGTNVYKNNMAQIANQTGRPDLESIPTDDWSKLPAWAGYQFLKNAPTLVAAIAASRAGGAKLAGMVPESAVTVGARAPTWLGGGGLRAGMTAEQVATARAAGARLAGDVAAAAPVTYPLAVGSLYGEAIDRGDPGKGDAALSFIGGVPYAALESLAPAKLEKFMAKGAEGGLFKRVATQALGTAPVEAITEGVQTAMEQGFGPETSFKEKAANIVEAMVTGGVVGGIAGGLTGIRKMKTADAAATPNDQLKGAVDEVLTGFDENGRLRSEFQKNPSNTYTQQPMLGNIPAPPEERQVAGATDADLQRQLGEIQQRDMLDQQRQGSAFNSAFLPPDATERANLPSDLSTKDAIIGEMNLRQQQAAPVPEVAQPGFDLFDKANIPLETQYAPQADEPPAEKQLTEVQKAKADFLGESKAKWAQDIINDPATEAVDLYAGIIRAINGYDSQRNASVPKKLLELGQKIGLFDAENQPRDLAVEYAAAVKKNNDNWTKVKLTQTGAKEAAAYQNNTLKPLENARKLLAQAQAKVEQESRPSPVARPPEEVPPPVQKAVRSAAVMSSPKNQLRLELRTNNPAVERGDTTWLQRQQQQADAKPDGKAVTGSMTAWTANAVDLPLKVIGKLPGVNPPSDTDQTKVSRLSKLVERNGWKPQPITIVVNHRGEAYVANGKARLEVARKTKQKNIPVNIEWMNGAELSNSPWTPAALISTLTGQPVAQMPLTPDPYSAPVAGQRASRPALAPRVQQTPAAAPVVETAPAPVAASAPQAAPVTAPVAETPAPAQAASLVPPGPAVWANADNDLPVNVVNEPPQADLNGRMYQRVEDGQGSSTFVPVDELKTRAETPTTNPPVNQVEQTEQTQPEPVVEQAAPTPKNANPKTLKDAVETYDNGVDLAKWIMRNTRDDVYKALMEKILPSLENTLVRVVQEGDRLPKIAANVMFDANGVYYSANSGERALFVWADRITENTLVHELLHAATNTRLSYGNRVDQQNTQLGRIVDEFMKLRDAVLDYYKKNSDPNKYDSRLEAAVSDVREMATYTFTNPQIREFFKQVPYAGGNAFSKFVELVRKLFNIPASQQSAFTRLIDLTEQLVDQPNPISTRPLDMSAMRGGNGSATPQIGNDDYVYVIHGGSDFDQIDLKNSGRGESGGIRPLGPGLYGYVLDPSNMSEFEAAVKGAQMYSRKYARGDKKLHVFRIPKNVNSNYVGMKSPVSGMGVTSEAEPYQVKMERLPINLTEVSVLDPAVAERLGKFDLNTAADEIYSALGGDGTVTPQLSGKMRELNDSAKNMMTTISNLENWLSNIWKSTTWREWSLKMNEWHLKTSTTQHIAEYFGAPFKRADGSNILLDWVKKQRERSVIQQRLAHLVRAGYLDFEKVKKTSAKAAQYVNDLMQYSALEIDPRKTWAEHTWLHGSKNEPTLIKLVAAANQTRRTLKQVSPDGLAVYENFIATNEAHHYIQQALSLYNLLQREGMVPDEFKKKLVNPMTKFLDDAKVYDSAVGARDYWKAATDDLVKQAADLVKSQTGQNITDPKMRDVVSRSANTIKARVEDITNEQAAMKQAPYFHIGRFGDNVLKFNVRKLEGKADPAALERIAKTLDDMGIRDVLIPETSNRANVFIRFESIATRDEAMRAMAQLEKQGFVSDIEAFRRSDEIGRDEISYQLPESVQKLMDSLKGNYLGENLGLDEEGQKLLKKLNRELQNHITQHFMNQLPDTAINKVMVHRNYVPGASKDFVRAYAFRTEIASRAIASLATAPDMSNLSGEMEQLTDDLRRSPDTQASTMAQQTVNELQIRESERPLMIKNTLVDYARAFTHTMFLGLSPGYIATQLTSIQTTLWPELSKRYGYVASAKAIARVTPTAVKVLQSVFTEGKKNGFKNLADATITREGLKNAGITGATAEFIIKIVNTGALDIGTQSREMGRISEGTEDSKVELALRWGSAAGYYSEMFTRTLAALAARELHGGNNNEMFDYALNTVQQSMFIFDADNTARATGRNGVLGAATPIVTQFQQYLYQVTEKLMREFYTGFRDSAATPEQKAEARRFMGAHLMGMGMVSGVLGWPMMSIAATILDKAVDMFGDDEDKPFNSQVALRNWLNYTFGDGVGNVIARGVPRALNFDVSKRVGEQDMLPFLQLFSKLISDRRHGEEAYKEWMTSHAGSAMGLVGNMWAALDKFNQGDLMGMAIEASPTVLRGPLQSIELGRKGYEDSKGNKQTITPGVSDYVWTAMGLTPAQKADYSEQNAAQASLRGDMIAKARVIRKGLLNAIEDGNMEKAQEMYDRAQKWDAANPDRKILDDIVSELKSRKKERDLAVRLGTGLGVKESDAPYTSFFNPQ